MQYSFETTYDQKTLTVMARCLRKTVRRARNKRSHIYGWIVVVLALLLSFSSGEVTVKSIVTWLVALVIVLALLFEDRLNGYFARKRMLKGTEKAFSTFDTERVNTFLSETAIGKTEFSYDGILLVAETPGYFVFLLSASHAQIYDKASLSGGTPEQFRAYITGKTNKEIMPVK